jgi:hypothetical protein
MSSEANETRKTEAAGAEAVATQAPTEQQESRRGTPKRFAVGQTVCNQKNEKGKLCNGHLKEIHTAGEAAKYLRGDDVLHQCQTCGTLYAGPPLGHVRDPSKQKRYVEKELAAILRAAGGTLPAYDYPVPEWRGEPARLPKPAKAPAAASAATPVPSGETPEEKKARLVAEHKAKLAAKSAPAAEPSAASAEGATSTQTPASSAADDATADSSPAADRHRPAAEAQAATGAASAAPLSPAAATASPAAGAESPSDLAPEASTELTPGAPRDERQEAAPPSTAAPAEAAAPEAAPKPKPKRVASAGAGGLPPIAPHLAPPPGETPEQKRERLRLVVEEAKRKAGKL